MNAVVSTATAPAPAARESQTALTKASELQRSRAKVLADELFDEALELGRVEALMRRVARGSRVDLAGAMALEVLATGGKRLRARLALQAAAALGARGREAVAWAAAVELLHNATLVHDDIEDGDTTRRGKPTLWAVHGVAQAINAGDLMLMLPYIALERIAPEARAELCGTLAHHAVRTVRGQVEEIELLPRGRCSWDAYEDAVRGKTGALMGLPVYGAAILAGRSRVQAEALGEAFVRLGVLFQLQDDVLDLYGDKGREVVGSDLYEGKVSALVVSHLERRPADRAWLLDLLRAPREETRPEDVADAIEAFRQSGALASVLDRIERLEAETVLDQSLRAEVALHQIALALAERATRPIEHLLKG